MDEARRVTEELVAEKGESAKVATSAEEAQAEAAPAEAAQAGGGCAPEASAPAPPEQNALSPESYAHNTCFEAGYLVAKNAGWRNIRPVIDPEACTGCLQCYLYCPDGTIYKTEHDPNREIPRLAGQLPFSETHKTPAANEHAVAPVAVDYDFCKGCGICAKVCRFNAITMEPESDFGAGQEVR